MGIQLVDGEAYIVTPDKPHPDKHTHMGMQTYTVFEYFLMCYLLLQISVTDWNLLTRQLSCLVIVSFATALFTRSRS